MEHEVIVSESILYEPAFSNSSTYSNYFTTFDKSDATKGAYLSDWEDFCMWCQQYDKQFLPADPCNVADYLEDRALNSWVGPCGKERKLLMKQPLKWNSLQRRLAAISKTHKNLGFVFDRSHPAIKNTLGGMKKKLSADKPTQIVEERKDPITIEDVRGMVESLPNNLTGIRDRALLLIGFAGALRRSELAGIRFEYVKFMNEGLEIFIPWTKTGPRTTRIPYGSNPMTCPVRALKEWIEQSGIKELMKSQKEKTSLELENKTSPLFRAINKHGQVQSTALTGAAISLIIKRNTYLIDKIHQRKLNNETPNYGGHSLRAGFATTAAREGIPEHLGMEQGGWKKSDTWKKYIRETNKWKNNAAAKIGL